MHAANAEVLVPGGDVLGIGDNGLSATPNCGPGSSTLAPTADTAPPSAASPLLATPDRRLRKGGRRGPAGAEAPTSPPAGSCAVCSAGCPLRTVYSRAAAPTSAVIRAANTFSKRRGDWCHHPHAQFRAAYASSGSSPAKGSVPPRSRSNNLMSRVGAVTGDARRVRWQCRLSW
jgi:hypothetical protein